MSKLPGILLTIGAALIILTLAIEIAKTSLLLAAALIFMTAGFICNVYGPKENTDDVRQAKEED